MPEFGYWKPIIESTWDDFISYVKSKGFATADISLAGLDLYCEWVYKQQIEALKNQPVVISELGSDKPDD